MELREHERAIAEWNANRAARPAVVPDGWTLYRPSNGTEGEIFSATFCDRCRQPSEVAYRELGDDAPSNPDGTIGCPILAASMAFVQDEPEYPKEWIWDDRMHSKCTAFMDEDEVLPPFVDPDQITMFQEDTDA